MPSTSGNPSSALNTSMAAVLEGLWEEAIGRTELPSTIQEADAVLAMPEMQAIRRALDAAAEDMMDAAERNGDPPITKRETLYAFDLPVSVIDWVVPDE